MAEHVDAALLDALREALDAHVRRTLAAADARSARDGSLATAIAPSLPVAIGELFELRSLRVDRAAWSGGEGEALAPGAIAGDPPGPGGPSSGERGGAADDDPLEAQAATGHAEDPLQPDGGVRGPAPGFADAPLRDRLGSSPVLADAWRRHAGREPDAIGAHVHGGEATVLVVQPDPDDTELSAELLDDLGAHLRAPSPRLILLPPAPTLRALIGRWLEEQAVPSGVTHAIVEDPARSRAVVELSGEDAAAFVERVATDGAADLGALGAVLPWGLQLRATTGEGVVVAPREQNVDAGPGAASPPTPATEAEA